MTEPKDTDLGHLQWVIKSRSDNQLCAVALFKLLTQYRKQWKQKKYSLAAQALVGVTFSLWRAAFLADKSGKRGAARESATEFLKTVIQDNAIGYQEDRKKREWTFNYYVMNARYTLIELAKNWPYLVPEYKQQTRPPKERWEYHQEMLKQTVTNFQKALASKR